CARRGDAMDYW
nr:immunoglobulin heavy chain junction region [Mus musculus]